MENFKSPNNNLQLELRVIVTDIEVKRFLYILQFIDFHRIIQFALVLQIEKLMNEQFLYKTLADSIVTFRGQEKLRL